MLLPSHLVGDQVFELFVVLVIGKTLLFEAIHLCFSIKEAMDGLLVCLIVDHTVLNQLQQFHHVRGLIDATPPLIGLHPVMEHLGTLSNDKCIDAT